MPGELRAKLFPKSVMGRLSILSWSSGNASTAALWMSLMLKLGRNNW